jgi:hypothetical protein
MDVNVKRKQFVIVDKATGAKSAPVSLEWFYTGEKDLQFENGDTLPLKDFIFFKEEYIIQYLNKPNW